MHTKVPQAKEDNANRVRIATLKLELPIHLLFYVIFQFRWAFGSHNFVTSDKAFFMREKNE